MGRQMTARCWSLDPIRSELKSGSVLNRHCLLPAGHDGMHQSRDSDGLVVHEWLWDGDDHAPRPLVQDTLF